jgi:CBS domain containing-hemolysin-like protein
VNGHEMNAVEVGIRIVAGAGLILTNGFFVAIEFALTRARQYSEAEFVGDGGGGLERAWEMTQELELYLTTCQVGITASSIAVGIVAEPALAALFEPLFTNTALAAASSGALVAFLIINLVHLTHGEQAPTYLGVERSRTVCRYGATPLYWFHRSISPIITFGDRVAKLTLKLFGVEMTGAWLETNEDVVESRAELRNRLGSVLDEGDVSEERHEEVINALDIGERPVREVMMPRDRIVALSTADDLEENLRRVREYPHARFPLVGEDLEAFVGVVYTPALLRDLEELRAGGTTLAKLAAPPMTVDPDEEVADLIDRFQAEHGELALVVDDDEVVGLVTATDAFEAITGDLEDPLDLEMPHLDT